MLKAWHDQVKEEAYSPSQEVVDAHHHFWDASNEKDRPMYGFQRVPYLLIQILLKYGYDPKMRGFWNFALGHRRGIQAWMTYLAPHLKRDLGGHKVIATVYIQCGWKSGAAGEVAVQRASNVVHGLPTCMVAEFKIQDGPEAAQKELDACAEAAGENFLVGFRTANFKASRPADSWMDGDARPINTPEAIAAAKLIGNRGYVIDICCSHLQLQELALCSKAAPATTFVLDHIGIPIGVGSCAPYGKVLPQWREDMKLLAQSPNVHVKLSGVGMPTFGFGLADRSIPPTSDECVKLWEQNFAFVIEAFGVDRCFFASNFPVDSVSCSYVVLWNAFKKIADKYKPEDRVKLLRDNAIKTYRLHRICSLSKL